MIFDDNDMDAMVGELRSAMTAIDAAGSEFAELSATVHSKDRTVTATVDGEGTLTALKINGQSWRDVPASELCARITQVVNEANAEVRRRGQEIFAAVSPVDAQSVDFLTEGQDLEAMMRGLAEQFERGAQ